MNIYDIDKLGKNEVDGVDVKTFYKKFNGDQLLGIEAGSINTNCGACGHVYLAFDVKDEKLISKYRNCIRYLCDIEDAPYRVGFLCSGIHELENFIEALEFAVGVLKQAKNLEQEWAF